MTMIAYKEIAQIKNVRGINPITGDYSYEENGRGYLYIDSVLLEKEETALDIVSVGEYVYVWYDRRRFELYLGHTLLKVFEKKVFLLDGNIGGYIGYHIRDPKTFEASENILSISDGQPLLAKTSLWRVLNFFQTSCIRATKSLKVESSSQMMRGVSAIKH